MKRNVIPLCPDRKIVVGRCPTFCKGTSVVKLDSVNLPTMLSRQHACLAFDEAGMQWTVEDMEASGINDS